MTRTPTILVPGGTVVRRNGYRKESTYLPIEPFRKWIEHLVLVMGNYRSVAELVGYNETAIRGWTNRHGPNRNRIALYIVDDVLTRADMDETIHSLYPDFR